MDEGEEYEAPRASSSASPSAAAWGVIGAASREKADAFLDEQIKVLRLEKEKLEKEDAAIDAEIALNLSHLRFRRLGDFTKFTLEGAAGILIVLVLVALGAIVFQAATDRSVVIDAFKVPQDMAQKGLTGDVVASAVLDHLVKLQAETDSSRAADTYASNWGNDIKVEIPETGISLGDAYRMLVGWLGHQTHITGEIYHTPAGIALVTRVGGHAGTRVEGHEADFDQLVERGAETVFRETQPYRYAILLGNVAGRQADAQKILQDLAVSGSDADRPWANSVLGEIIAVQGNVDLGLALTRKGYALAPDLPMMSFNLAQVDAVAGYDEDELRMVRVSLRSLSGEGASMITSQSAAVFAVLSRVTIDEQLGDFQAAADENQRALDGPDYERSHFASYYEKAADLALAHDIRGSRAALGGGSDSGMEEQAAAAYGWELCNFLLPQYSAFADLSDWRAARADAERLLRLPVTRGLGAEATNRTMLRPWLALSEAETGDVKAARVEIAKTPGDCYLCLRVRGQIDARAGNMSGAAFWFSRAIAAAPSIPFAYANWGAALLRAGQYDAAIAKFKTAHDKGPRFADALEMWGEALMQENRSDLALAKFQEASQSAPNWGRLRLKWGEALVYAGHKDEAKAQFAEAGNLELSVGDRAALARRLR